MPSNLVEKPQPSDLIELLDCPLCGGASAWCDTLDPEDLHCCHFIVCVGDCKTQFDTVADDDAAETIDELKIIAAKKYNIRAI